MICGRVGESQQTYTSELEDGYIVMKTARPESDLPWVASASGDWVVSIDDAKTKKLKEFYIETGEKIRAGFNSNALTYQCQYRCNDHDQSRIRNAFISGVGGNIWRNETLTKHTKNQAEQVFLEMIEHIDLISIKYDALCRKVKNSTDTAEDILKMNWES